MKLALCTSLSFLVLIAPFAYAGYTHPVEEGPAGFAGAIRQVGQVAHRVFPFARGLFEDKVANFWVRALFHSLGSLFWQAQQRTTDDPDLGVAFRHRVIGSARPTSSSNGVAFSLRPFSPLSPWHSPPSRSFRKPSISLSSPINCRPMSGHGPGSAWAGFYPVLSRGAP